MSGLVISKLIEAVKKTVERLLGCRIYRCTLPRGTDLFWDLSSLIPASEVVCVMDVGCHIGESTTVYLQAFPNARILAFEPCKALFEQLGKKFEREPRVEIKRLALSNQNREVTLHLKAFSSTHSLIDDGNSIGMEVVNASTLDSFCQGSNIQRIDFLKIDTEGHDLEVLRGSENLLESGAINVLQIETSMRHDITYFSRLEEVDNYLAARKYEIFGFYEQQKCWTGRNSLLYFNVVYVRTALVSGIAPM